MSWSLNELEAETRKAIRGAGYAWGMSEDGAKAVRSLAARGVDPLPALSDVLDRHDRNAISDSVTITEAGRWHAAAPMCPIALGVALCDHSDRLAAGTLFAGPVARPLLLIPFVAAAARMLKRCVQIEVQGMRIVLNERGDPSGDLAVFDVPDAAEMRCGVVENTSVIMPFRPASTRGIDTDPKSWTRLSSYVHRTYVPASERSRREGAGAGLIDND